MGFREQAAAIKAYRDKGIGLGKPPKGISTADKVRWRMRRQLAKAYPKPGRGKPDPLDALLDALKGKKRLTPEHVVRLLREPDLKRRNALAEEARMGDWSCQRIEREIRAGRPVRPQRPGARFKFQSFADALGTLRVEADRIVRLEEGMSDAHTAGKFAGTPGEKVDALRSWLGELTKVARKLNLVLAG